MSNATSLTPMQTFEEKVKSKLKESIADMLPDEAISSLVQRAVDEQFFKPTRVNVGSEYSPRYEDAPSWFVKEVAKLGKGIIEEAVKKEFFERKPEIEAAIANFVKDQNLALLMTASMSVRTSSMIWDASNNIISMINNKP